MKRFHTILCPTDFSHGSEAAFQYALDLARDYNARLVVLHSQEPAVAMIPEAGLIPIELPDNETAARKLLDDVRAVGPAITLEKIFAEGPAVQTINARSLDKSAPVRVDPEETSAILEAIEDAANKFEKQD